MLKEIQLIPNCSEAAFRLKVPKLEEAKEIYLELNDAVDGGASSKIVKAKSFKELEKVSFVACAGMGSGKSQFIHDKKDGAIFLVGNNTLSENSFSAQGIKNRYGKRFTEAEKDKVLSNYTRDCTCGITWYAEDD